MYFEEDEHNRKRPLLQKDDIIYLLENTTFDEYDIREWFREFIKVGLVFISSVKVCVLDLVQKTSFCIIFWIYYRSVLRGCC